MVSQGFPRRLWVVLVVGAAAIGLAVFTVLLRSAVQIEQIDSSGALERFEDVHADFKGTSPLLQRDGSGRLVRHERVRTDATTPTQLHVLAYRASQERLFQVDVPVWFLKIKGPAVEYALRDTGFDLAALGLTAGDLEHAGPGLILDEADNNGDRLLAWTE
jgi:hypothetical protein